RGAAGRQRERREDADRRRLPRAVVAEQAEDASARDVEIDVFARAEVAVALAEAFGADRLLVHRTTSLDVQCTACQSGRGRSPESAARATRASRSRRRRVRAPARTE